jgi:hypothetical protein
MASLVNPFNINGNYPIAGQDNDSQGFRDNFTNIKNNFIFIKQEVEDMQSKVILKSALSGSSLDNNFLGSQVKNIQTKNQSETVYDWGEVGGATATEIQLDLALGNIHKINATGSIKINSVIKNWPAALQYSKLLLYINISSITNTLELPSTLTTDTASLPGLRVIASSKLITFTDSGDYIFEFTSVDSGTTVFVRELTKGNPVFRDPNFYMAGIGGYTTPTLRLGWGNLFPISAKIDTVTKSGIDTFSVRGGVTSFVNFVDGGNNPNDMTQAGFSIAKSRTTDTGAGWDGSGETVINSGDYIGYFNSLAYTNKSDNSGNKSYQQMALIGMYASGSNTSYGLGGNIVISTKRDGGSIAPAITIDNNQDVVFLGNIRVDGVQTIINSTVLSVDDKNIVVAQGADPAFPSQSNSSGIIVDGVYANILYFADDGTLSANIRDRWHTNKAFTVDATTTSTSSSTGALVVAGGLGIAENLNVGGSFGLTSTTEAINTTTAAFALSGGLSTAKNIIAGGNLLANATTTASNLVSGAFQVTGGAAVRGNLYIGGQQDAGTAGVTQTGLYVLSSSTSGNTASGALVVKGGAGIAGNVYLSDATSANGVVVSSTLNVPGTMLWYSSSTTDGNVLARTNTAAFRVRGGSILEGNVIIGTGSIAGRPHGRLFIDNSQNITVGDIRTGGVVLGNAAAIVGMSVSGDMNIGTADSGTIYIINKEAALGTPTTSPLTPYVPTKISSDPVYGSLTSRGGINVFGDTFIGQPHGEENINASGVWSPMTTNADTKGQVGTPAILAANPYYGTPYGAASGNLVLQSGTRAFSFTSGALQIKQVTWADGSTSDGGAGIAGNLFVNSAAFLGGFGISSNFANLVAASSTESTDAFTSPNGSFVALGGAGIKKRLNVGGNVVIQSTSLATFSSGVPATGALILTGTGGIAAGGTIIAGSGMSTGNLLIAAGGTTTTPVQLTTGTLNTTAVAGGLEFNSGIWYATPSAGSRGIMNTSHLFILSANSTLGGTVLSGGAVTATNTGYGIFGGATGIGTAGQFNAVAGTTYQFELKVLLGTSGTPGSSTMQFSFGGTGTTATYNWYQYQTTCANLNYVPGSGTVQFSGAAGNIAIQTFAGTSTLPNVTSGVVVAANQTLHKVLEVNGIISVNTAGTILPQVSFGSALNVIVQALPGSYFKLTPIGGTSTFGVGNFVTS